jgi:N-acetylglutamate synthase-like GNAT family acetyltransferase
MRGAKEISVRRACPGDVDVLDTLHKASIRELCSSAYTGEQISDWISAIKPRGYLLAMEMYEFLVAVRGAAVGLGIFNSSKAEITALYVSPAEAGSGVGRAILLEVEALARETGIQELRLKSTLNAVGFYEKMGYARIEQSAYVLPSGMELPFVVMAKKLRPVGRA